MKLQFSQAGGPPPGGRTFDLSGPQYSAWLVLDRCGTLSEKLLKQHGVRMNTILSLEKIGLVRRQRIRTPTYPFYFDRWEPVR